MSGWSRRGWAYRMSAMGSPTAAGAGGGTAGVRGSTGVTRR